MQSNLVDRIKLKLHAGDALHAFLSVEQSTTLGQLDSGLRHLVKLRASQMNGCAFCVMMHTAEARRDGEWNERLDRLVVWREVADFTPAERAALAWTEALTRLDDTGSMAPLYTALTQHYSDEQIAALTVVVAMINLWNRVGIAAHGGAEHEHFRHD